MQKKIVISGFERFGNYQLNSSQIIANKLHGNFINRFQIRSVVFPACISKEDRSKKILDTGMSYEIRAVIALGMASEAKGFRFEKLALNHIFNPKYALPDQNGKPIRADRDKKEGLFTDLLPWNTANFAWECQKSGLPHVDFSSDAGGWCCNQLLYQLLLRNQESRNPVPIAFIHIPCCPGTVTSADESRFAKEGKVLLPVERIISGLQLLIQNADL
jgi:pyroglutamyl-peptidase